MLNHVPRTAIMSIAVAVIGNVIAPPRVCLDREPDANSATTIRLSDLLVCRATAAISSDSRRHM
jgi:hypothetical protein